ncbi:terminase large subunit [Peribacillus simplex]|uniref:terminase TerL endonuclease subunit n=1 Tax=Peribacillus simplex TaxID=1478 RepID=UPI001920F104|nr:terminase TerL endonuclease subunit [Peribacillus simplex]MBD8589190.1 terminase large subunit [Peribacillus simplex]
MISNKYVQDYIDLYENGKIQLNKERIMLLDHLQERVLTRDDLYFDETLIENFIKFAEKWYFPLQPFQKFIAAFVFLFYKEDDSIFYEQFLIFMARGGGKNGFVSALCHFFLSPLHGISRYNISIVANNEKQSKISFKEIYEAIEANKVLEDMFYCTKVEITGNDTKSVLQYHTSNAGTKDGLRDGAVIYDEIHQYENFDVVNVFSSGLGKVPNGREFFIGTDGYVREGFLDKMKERAMNILEGKELDDPLFPFICKIDESKEVDDPDMWEKANPMFSEPRSVYAKRLFKKVLTQFKQLASNPSNREEFMTKRMNLPEVNLEKVVAPWSEVLATNITLPELKNRTCIGGLDYASIRDFAAVGLLFKVEGKYIWVTHSFARKQYLEVAKLKPPIYEWEKQGLLTIVDEPSIDPQHIVNWFLEQKKKYGLTKVISDNFRMDLLRPLFEANGLDYEIVRNPRAIHSLLAPRIEDAFANKKIIWGKNPLMNWYVGNTAVKIKNDGNKEYIKKDEHRRKTDGFQAFIHAMYRADEIDEMDISSSLDLMDSLVF